MSPRCAPLASFLLLLGAPAHAAPEEIQVYQDEINKAGEIGLDLHLNTVADGDRGIDYAGAEPSLHRWRATPEFSLGLGRGFEAGLYLPLATVASDGVFRAEGAKIRLKWIAPHDETKGFYWGGNFEIGRVAYAIDQNPWNAEFKAIAGWRKGKLSVAVNGNFDFVVSGPAPGPATFDFDTKIGYSVSPKWTLGIETYNGVGALKALGHFGASDQSAYLIADTHVGKWDINFGIGKGYGANVDSIIIKSVVSVPLPQFKRRS
jgi:hypothetical protein